MHQNINKKVSLKWPAYTQSSDTSYEAVSINPGNILQPDVKQKFQTLLQTYSEVFNLEFQSYIGAAGPFKTKIYLGSVQPPQRKGRVPQYNRDKLLELQNKFEELKNLDVFQRPEDIGIPV